MSEVAERPLSAVDRRNHPRSPQRGCAPPGHVAAGFLDTGMDNGNEQQAGGLNETLERVAMLVESLVGRVEGLEQRVGDPAFLHRALRVEEAEKYLPIKKSAINALIRSGEIRTITYGKSPRRYIPMAEIVRLNSIPEAPTDAPTVPSKTPPKRAARVAKEDADEILAFARSLKRRR